MFENQPSRPQEIRVLAPEGEPIEFLYQGRRFHVHSIVSRWRESGGWWNRISDGSFHETDSTTILDDGARALWWVEAAPIGAVMTFEIEFDEITKSWHVRPTSSPRT